jgi:hypothetical protein
MPRKLSALALILFVLFAGGKLWSAGQKADIFAPVDALIEEKRYTEAIDMLRGLLISNPKKTSSIKDRIAKALILKADDDIEAQRYNEALAELSLFWAQYPEKADVAQKRIRKVNQVREEYNKKAKELLVYMSDAANRGDTEYNKNVTKKLQDLDDLDRNNPDSKKTITSLKETSLALVNQDTMKAIMRSGRALIDKGSYSEAAHGYLKGFELFKPEFSNAGYDAITMQAVEKESQRAAVLPDSYASMQYNLTKAVSDLVVAFESGRPEAVRAALPAAEASFEELRVLRSSIFAAGSSLAAAYSAIPKEGKSPIEYQYLAFLDIFIRGRPDSFGEDKKPQAEKGLPEGIGGVLLAQTDALLTSLQTSIEKSVDSAYAEAEKAFDSGDYAAAQSTFSRSAALVAPALSALGKWSEIPDGDFVPTLVALRLKISRGAAAANRIGRLESLAAAGAKLSGLAEAYVKTSAEAARYVEGVDAGKTTALAEVRIAMDGYRSTIRAIEASIAQETEAAPSFDAATAETVAKIGDDRPTLALSAYKGRLAATATAAREAEYTVAATRGRLEGDYIGRELAARSAAVDAADARTDGAVSKLPERARAGYRDPAPSESSVSLAAEAKSLAALASWISSDLASMGAEPEALLKEAAFASARARIEDLGGQTEKLEARRSAALARAIERKKAAVLTLAAAKTDMDAARARLADSKTLISQDKGKGTKASAIKKGFVDSNDRLDRSLNAIIESSTTDFDPKSWDDFQKLYASVKADLAQTKKDYVINETFRLLAEGQTFYEQTLFDLAGESLVAAQELWHEDNDTDQEQVKYWQNLVRQASDTNNKREVKQSDALYYEIGSYLSEARKLYQKGDGLIKSGRKNDAASAFDSARQNIGFVTRAFPLNAEAGFLTLQILKSTDAEAYKKSLPRRIQEAVDLLATDATSGYSRIADLYKMEPGYPGLRATLERAEIKVGKRRAPPTKEDLANAAALVAQAEKLLGSGRKDDAARAEANLNAALTYDPTNKRVLALLRDLKTLQGKTAGPSLGLADQAILDQATRSFAARQYNQARDQLSQLLAEPGKRTREVLKLDNDLKTLGYD